QGQFRADALPHFFEPALDFPNTLQIVVDACLVLSAEALAQARGLAGNGVENAAELLAARAPLVGRRALPEQPLEHLVWVVLHRQRRRRRTEGDRARIAAPELAVARAAATGPVLGGQFERRQRRVLADVLGRNLIDSDPAV